MSASYSIVINAMRPSHALAWATTRRLLQYTRVAYILSPFIGYSLVPTAHHSIAGVVAGLVGKVVDPPSETDPVMIGVQMELGGYYPMLAKPNVGRQQRTTIVVHTVHPYKVMLHGVPPYNKIRHYEVACREHKAGG